MKKIIIIFLIATSALNAQVGFVQNWQLENAPSEDYILISKLDTLFGDSFYLRKYVHKDSIFTSLNGIFSLENDKDTVAISSAEVIKNLKFIKKMSSGEISMGFDSVFYAIPGVFDFQGAGFKYLDSADGSYIINGLFDIGGEKSGGITYQKNNAISYFGNNNGVPLIGYNDLFNGYKQELFVDTTGIYVNYNQFPLDTPSGEGLDSGMYLWVVDQSGYRSGTQGWINLDSIGGGFDGNNIYISPSDSNDVFVTPSQLRDSLNLINVSGDVCSDPIYFDLKVFLEGPYDTLTGQMNGVYGANLPERCPLWNQEPVYYDEFEIVEPNSESIDWVVVKLRTVSNDPTSTVLTMAGIVQADGTIRFEDKCNTDLGIDKNLQYEITVQQAVHSPIGSHMLVSFINDTLSYDFTLQNGKEYDIIPGVLAGKSQKQLSDGSWVMRAGEANRDMADIQDINSSDNTFLFGTLTSRTQTGIIGSGTGYTFPNFRYIYADVNNDGIVNSTDQDIWFRNSADLNGIQF